MRLFGGNIFTTLQNRMSAVIAAVGASALVCLCGALMTFVLAPQQALKAYRVSRLPLMDAPYVASAAPDSEILVTGYLQGSQAAPDLQDFIAYSKDRWEVSLSQEGQGTESAPSGSWRHEETVVPTLTLDMDGTPVTIHSSSYASLGGNLHETIIDGTGSLQARDGERLLRDGALRYRGFYNGDQVTVFGTKDTNGTIIPADIFAGDRASYETYQKQAAGFLFFGGIAMLVCSPVVLVLGVLGAMFGRRRGL